MNRIDNLHDPKPTTALARISLLTLGGYRSWTVQAALIIAAVVLPAVCHLLDLPTRWILPMHWPVISAGLFFGWRAGLVVGLLAPASNFLLTGYPLFPKMLAMTAELAVYGGLTGWLREALRWNGFAATAAAAVTGRVVFLAGVTLLGATDGAEFWSYAAASMLPGLVGGVGMVGILGLVSILIRL